ncbi:hypothetical protein R0382_003298 [Jeongeupia wiesaeckerbachi]
MPDSDLLAFCDSEVSNIETRAGHIVVRISAGHVHRSGGLPGADDRAGFLQALELTCFQPSAIHQEAGCVGNLSSGVLRVGGAMLRLVPVPFESACSVELELVFSNGSVCRVTCLGVTLKPAGEARFVEWLKC